MHKYYALWYEGLECLWIWVPVCQVVLPGSNLPLTQKDSCVWLIIIQRWKGYVLKCNDLEPRRMQHCFCLRAEDSSYRVRSGSFPGSCQRSSVLPSACVQRGQPLWAPHAWILLHSGETAVFSGSRAHMLGQHPLLRSQKADLIINGNYLFFSL